MIKMAKNTLVIIVMLFFWGCDRSSQSSPGMNSVASIISAFETQIQKDLKDDNIEGSISAAIIKNDEIIWSKAFGYSNSENRTLADTTTIYRTGSISKSFTAFLMMQ
ncbi:MAG: hypothetical protein C0490_17845, partial [Marivirga sp.]|nr:hypothetical protein [Marivirga sp.]